MAMMFASKHEKDGHMKETGGLNSRPPEESKDGQNTPLYYIELVIKILTNPPALKYDPANENSLKAAETYNSNFEKAKTFL